MKRIFFLAVSLLLLAVAFVALFPVTAVDLYANSTHTYIGLGLDAKARIVFFVIGAASILGAMFLARSAVRS
ncbi:MAG TPA: hypothetical protein VMF58_06740 [Rhizomicrobium sp.]|nr:hypothetical protein [Rhizomicrobium sp.]